MCSLHEVHEMNACWQLPCYVGPCHHGMTRSRVADARDGLQIWRVAGSIYYKQSQTADKGWSSSLEVRRGANNSSP
jgi:hypothetical protein